MKLAEPPDSVTATCSGGGELFTHARDQLHSECPACVTEAERRCACHTMRFNRSTSPAPGPSGKCGKPYG